MSNIKRAKQACYANEKLTMDYTFCMKATHYFYKLHTIIHNVSKHEAEAVVVMTVWQLDLQLPVQSVPITTKVMRLKFVSDL